MSSIYLSDQLKSRLVRQRPDGVAISLSVAASRNWPSTWLTSSVWMNKPGGQSGPAERSIKRLACCPFQAKPRHLTKSSKNCLLSADCGNSPKAERTNIDANTS